ncbi:hypothetical protein DY000_02025528 [Brassica cretica]|uniref:Bifunctional inhibitor/plant lipid transfer protein/seed storage helical domain-containing protein n=1 Tax=Brassica cretica TaxID=69181 RepID=A0ABQ7EDX7_BRACR|nr:hypothetical protein DY000_02025528 [Brassica cretica]
MKLTAIGLVAMVTIVVQLSPTMACDVKDLFPCLLPITNLPEPPTAACCQTLRDQGPCLYTKLEKRSTCWTYRELYNGPQFLFLDLCAAFLTELRVI